MATKTRKPRQTVLASLAPQYVSELDEAVNAFIEAREAKKAAAEEEEKAADVLVAALKRHKTSVYTTPEGRRVTIKHSAADRISVKTVKPAAHNGEAGK